MVYYLRTNELLCRYFFVTLLILQDNLLIYDASRTEECHLSINYHIYYFCDPTCLAEQPLRIALTIFILYIVFRLLHLIMSSLAQSFTLLSLAPRWPIGFPSQSEEIYTGHNVYPVVEPEPEDRSQNSPTGWLEAGGPSVS